MDGAHIEEVAGRGRKIVIVYEQEGRLEAIAGATAHLLPESVQTYLVSIKPFAEQDWQERAHDLEQALLLAKIKNACLVGFASASSLVIHCCLNQPKLVRSLVLVDATTRPHPSRITRIIDKIENYLPVGLPFRSHRRTFNAAPFLQRIRCPAAVVTTSSASSYHLEEAEIFKSLLPTAWTRPITADKSSEDLSKFICDFQDVAAKRPQKNLGRNQSKASV